MTEHVRSTRALAELVDVLFMACTLPADGIWLCRFVYLNFSIPFSLSSFPGSGDGGRTSCNDRPANGQRTATTGESIKMSTLTKPAHTKLAHTGADVQEPGLAPAIGNDLWPHPDNNA